MFRQSECQLLDSQARLRPSTLGCFAHYEVCHHRCHVFELQGTDASAQRGVRAVTRIQHQDTARHARGVSFADLLKRDLRFSLEGDCLGNPMGCA